MTTRNPRALSRLPRLEPVRPLPSEEATPPGTKMCLACRLAPDRADEDKACSRGWVSRCRVSDPREFSLTPGKRRCRRHTARHTRHTNWSHPVVDEFGDAA